MNKSILLGIFIIFSLFLFMVLNTTSTGKSNSSNNETTQLTSSATLLTTPADKIEVVHFHGTQQCASCITVGKLALKTIQDKFPEEYNTGKIAFKEINGELPENDVIVRKYQARGSSLFVNAIRDEKEEIIEDTTVWRLVNNEDQYIDYFEGKLKTLIGK